MEKDKKPGKDQYPLREIEDDEPQRSPQHANE
jgi:hypothetical protein